MKRARPPELFSQGLCAQRLDRGSSAAIVGIDWSGSKRAGKLIWLAEGELATGYDERLLLTIDRAHCAASLPGGDTQRATAVAAVRSHLLALTASLQGQSLWCGVDSPLSLPTGVLCSSHPLPLQPPPTNPATSAVHAQACLPAGGPWRRFMEKYPWRDEDADQLRDWACRAGGGERKRVCDVAAKAPFAPTNLRLYRQTHAAFGGLLMPLLSSGRASVVPNSLAPSSLVPPGVGEGEPAPSAPSAPSIPLAPPAPGQSHTAHHTHKTRRVVRHGTGTHGRPQSRKTLDRLEPSGETGRAHKPQACSEGASLLKTSQYALSTQWPATRLSTALL